MIWALWSIKQSRVHQIVLAVLSDQWRKTAKSVLTGAVEMENPIKERAAIRPANLPATCAQKEVQIPKDLLDNRQTLSKSSQGSRTLLSFTLIFWFQQRPNAQLQQIYKLYSPGVGRVTQNNTGKATKKEQLWDNQSWLKQKGEDLYKYHQQRT